MSGAIVLGIEELFSNLLGIQQLSVAMRRNPDEIEACRNIGADEWAHSPQETVATCKAWAEL